MAAEEFAVGALKEHWPQIDTDQHR